jgi:hypothetical protein
VFGAVPLGAPADGNEDGTRCKRRIALGLKHSGKNWHNPLLGVVCLLTTGVLIRVRRLYRCAAVQRARSCSAGPGCSCSCLGSSCVERATAVWFEHTSARCRGTPVLRPLPNAFPHCSTPGAPYDLPLTPRQSQCHRPEDQGDHALPSPLMQGRWRPRRA